jgi:hypothetical protein
MSITESSCSSRSAVALVLGVDGPAGACYVGDVGEPCDGGSAVRAGVGGGGREPRHKKVICKRMSKAWDE